MTTRFMIPRGGPGEADHVVISVDGRSFKIMKGVEYVVREKGEWVFDAFTARYGNPYRCPKCKEEYSDARNFCPECGADMRKGENDG